MTRHLSYLVLIFHLFFLSAVRRSHAGETPTNTKDRQGLPGIGNSTIESRAVRSGGLARRSLMGARPRRSPKSITPAPSTHGLTMPTGLPFAIGSPTGMIDIWVDPQGGRDSNSGTSSTTALRTLTAAWNKIPVSKKLTKGYHIRIKAGTLHVEDQPNYWEHRWGSITGPIIIDGADPGRTAHLSPVNIFDTRFLYFINVAFDVETNDQVHCEQCVAFLLRNCTVKGTRGSAWEAIKVNQCTGVYIENSDVSGGDDNAIDMVAVRFGHILDSKIYNANWCIYHKGGSAHHYVARNEIYDCGESGYASGQGTGLEFMVAPWIRYEAYDIRVVNNVFHDVWGAALGVYGGQNILYAYNTLYKVGERSHTIEVNLGDRQCDGDTARCTQLLAAGAWGSTSGSAVKIPNVRVMILNNIVYNPTGYQSQWQHMQIQGPESDPASSNIPGGTAVADTGLVIKYVCVCSMSLL